MRRSLWVALCGLAFSAGQSIGSAETIVFTSGGKMKARVLADESSDTTLVLRSGKGRISIPRSQVKEIRPDADSGPEYQKMLADAPDTADGQYELAKWCDEHNLPEQARAALERAIAIDPNHAASRKRLGYVRQGDAWISREQYLKARGFEQVEGRWVTSQEKSVIAKNHAAENTERKWFREIRLWKSWLVGRDAGKARQAEDSLNGITDPLALKALDKILGGAREPSVRLFLTRILARIPSTEATRSLVRRAVIDSAESVRTAAAEQLRERGDSGARKMLISGLKSSDNRVVNRCGEALGILGDKAATPALIDALITRHQTVVMRPGAGSSSFFGTIKPQIIDFQPVVGSRGALGFTPTVAPMAAGFGMGGGGEVPENVTVAIQNSGVLGALEELTGESLGFDPLSWRRWWALEYRKQELTHKNALPEP